MPTTYHQNAEQNVSFAPPTHAANILADEPQQTTDAQTSFAEPQAATHGFCRRYKVTWASLLSSMKWSDVLIVALVSLIMTGIWAAVGAMMGKPSFLIPTLFGSVLLMVVVQLKETHQAKFTGHRALSWLISWLFRATLWFAFFAILRVMRQKNLVVLDEALAACIFATGSIVWQYWRQSRRDAKTR